MALLTALHRHLVRPSVAHVARQTLAVIAGGQLRRLPVTLSFWDGSRLPADSPAAPTVSFRRPRSIAHLLHEPGELGLSRGFVDGSLTTDDDLESLLSLRSRMRTITLTHPDRARLAIGALRAAGPAVLRHPPVPSIEATIAGERHSRRRDQAAIRHHYDVSNDFYRLVLGPSLVYSCAYYADPDDTLEQAQERKLDLICRKLDLRDGERFLDIGCGWGSLALHAAAHYGARVTGVTLSHAQATLARERVDELGLSRQVEIRVADYRELAGATFDKIACVGMYEHVGSGELRHYARAAFELLAPGGLMLNHGIARLDAQPPDPKTFIARYVFPDGELHPVAELVTALQSAHLEVRDIESLREHYPLTLRAWLANLRARRDDAQTLVGAERVRTWDLYMTGSAMAFAAGEIGIYQVLCARMDGPHRLPLDRLALLAPDAVSARTLTDA